MREPGSDADWFWAECLVYHHLSLIREFGHVRREDGKEIADGVYQALDYLGTWLRMEQTRQKVEGQLSKKVEQVIEARF